MHKVEDIKEFMEENAMLIPTNEEEFLAMVGDLQNNDVTTTLADMLKEHLKDMRTSKLKLNQIQSTIQTSNLKNHEPNAVANSD